MNKQINNTLHERQYFKTKIINHLIIGLFFLISIPTVTIIAQTANTSSVNVTGLAANTMIVQAYDANNYSAATKLLVETDGGVENILTNSDSESPLTTGWTGDWGNTSVITSTKNSGANALQVGPGAGGRAQVVTSGFTVGNQYTLSAYCMLSESGNAGTAYIGVVCIDAAGVKTLIKSDDITNTGSFVKMGFSFTVPAATTMMEVHVWYSGGTPSVYIDDFIMIPGAGEGFKNKDKKIKKSKNEELNPTKDKEYPSAPGNLNASKITKTSFELAWLPATDNVGVTGYKIYKNGEWFAQTTNTTVTVTGLKADDIYTMVVQAYDAANNYGAEAKLLVTTDARVPKDKLAPSVPLDLAVTKITETSCTISWSKSADNIGVAGYELYNNGEFFGSGKVTTVMITELTCGTNYNFTVKAYDGAEPANLSAASNQAIFTTLPCKTVDKEYPSIPQNFSASSITTTSFILTWLPSKDNTGVTGYKIYKDGAWFAQTTNTNVAVTGLKPGSSSTMVIQAYDAANNYSGEAKIVVTTSRE